MKTKEHSSGGAPPKLNEEGRIRDRMAADKGGPKSIA